MKTELKDVLHFYLGCDFLLEKSGRIARIQGIVYEPELQLLERGDWKFYSIFPFRPILRPLSDIKKEEAKIYLETVYNATSVNIGNKTDSGIWFYFHGTSHEKFINYADFKHPWPDGFIYLLNNGFDLFELIESGQAIDKTTLNN